MLSEAELESIRAHSSKPGSPFVVEAALVRSIDALTAERDAERALADELANAGGLVAELLAQWQMGIFHGCLPSGVQASVPGVLKRWNTALSHQRAARGESP